MTKRVWREHWKGKAPTAAETRGLLTGAAYYADGRSTGETVWEAQQAAMATAVRRFLPPGVVAELNAYIDSLPVDGAGQVISNLDGSGVVDTYHRRCSVRTIRIGRGSPAIALAFHRAVCGFIREANGALYGYDIERVPREPGNPPSYMVAEYGPGDEFKDHWDWGGTDASNLRKLSCTVQLTDPRRYSGGELEIFAGGGYWTAPRELGAITAFPSNFYHHVNPIKRGRRRSAVAWFRGERPFR